jgi:hypothetical protein
LASESPRLIWSEEAVAGFESVSSATREMILRRVRLLFSNPRMYQVEGTGRWAGLRRFAVEQRIVFYMYWDAEHTIYIEAIVPARNVLSRRVKFTWRGATFPLCARY